MKKIKIWLAALFFCLPSGISANSIHTPGITESTLAALPHCLDYQIQGVCYWLTDTGETITTPYISHYLPDLVVSVFNPPTDKKGGNPWIEMDGTIDQVGKVAQQEIISTLSHVKAGGGQHGFENPLQQNVFFKEVDIVGNPALLLLPTTPALLPSTAHPLNPYFQSMLDSVLWRGFPPHATPEQAYALTANITHFIGSRNGAINWGGTYPFEGKVVTSNDAKAAAVIAQRASILLTAKNSWTHIHQSLSTNCGQECQAAVIQENDEQTRFQLVHPRQQSSCQVFGKTMDYGTDFEPIAQGAYVWVLWRYYQGCIQGLGSYIGKMRIN